MFAWAVLPSGPSMGRGREVQETPLCLPHEADMSETTQTGITIIDCDLCEMRHPVTRGHCPECGRPSIFPHNVHAGETS